jgi:choline transport protein
MPLNALALIAVVSFILSLIYIGSSTAYNAIVSLTAIGLNVSYVIPISFFLLRKVRGPPLAYGPFQLGRWGIPVNLASLAHLDALPSSTTSYSRDDELRGSCPDRHYPSRFD